MRGEKRKDPSVRVSRRRGDEMLVSREVDETMADHGVGGGEEFLGGGTFADGDHQAAVDDDLMLGLDGEDHIFSEDTFPALPDFPCLSSPSATPSLSSASTFRAKSAVLPSCSSTSSSSSSASWSFLQVLTAAA